MPNANTAARDALSDAYNPEKKKKIPQDVFGIGKAIKNIKKLRAMPRLYSGMKK